MHIIKHAHFASEKMTCEVNLYRNGCPDHTPSTSGICTSTLSLSFRCCRPSSTTSTVLHRGRLATCEVRTFAVELSRRTSSRTLCRRALPPLGSTFGCPFTITLASIASPASGTAQFMHHVSAQHHHLQHYQPCIVVLKKHLKENSPRLRTRAQWNVFNANPMTSRSQHGQDGAQLHTSKLRVAHDVRTASRLPTAAN